MSLAPLISRVKELDPAVTDCMVAGILHGFSVADQEVVLRDWISDLEAETLAEAVAPQVRELLEVAL